MLLVPIGSFSFRLFQPIYETPYSSLQFPIEFQRQSTWNSFSFRLRFPRCDETIPWYLVSPSYCFPTQSIEMCRKNEDTRTTLSDRFRRKDPERQRRPSSGDPWQGLEELLKFLDDEPDKECTDHAPTSPTDDAPGAVASVGLEELINFLDDEPGKECTDHLPSSTPDSFPETVEIESTKVNDTCKELGWEVYDLQWGEEYCLVHHITRTLLLDENSLELLARSQRAQLAQTLRNTNKIAIRETLCAKIRSKRNARGRRMRSSR